MCISQKIYKLFPFSSLDKVLMLKIIQESETIAWLLLPCVIYQDVYVWGVVRSLHSSGSADMHAPWWSENEMWSAYTEHKWFIVQSTVNFQRRPFVESQQNEVLKMSSLKRPFKSHHRTDSWLILITIQNRSMNTRLKFSVGQIPFNSVKVVFWYKCHIKATFTLSGWSESNHSFCFLAVETRKCDLFRELMCWHYSYLYLWM